MRKWVVLLTLLVLAVAVAVGLWQFKKSGPRRAPSPLRAGEAFTIHVRWGVAEVRARKAGQVEELAPDLLVKADSRVFKEMLGGLRGPALALAGFDYPKGGAIAFGRFLKLFTPPKMKRPFEPYPTGDGAS